MKFYLIYYQELKERRKMNLLPIKTCKLYHHQTVEKLVCKYLILIQFLLHSFLMWHPRIQITWTVFSCLLQIFQLQYLLFLFQSFHAQLSISILEILQHPDDLNLLYLLNKLMIYLFFLLLEWILNHLILNSAIFIKVLACLCIF